MGVAGFVGRYFATSKHLIGYIDTGALASGVFVIFGAAGMAFMLGVSEYWLVYHTSSLTLVISGVFKVSPCVMGSHHWKLDLSRDFSCKLVP